MYKTKTITDEEINIKYIAVNMYITDTDDLDYDFYYIDDEDYSWEIGLVDDPNPDKTNEFINDFNKNIYDSAEKLLKNTISNNNNAASITIKREFN